MGIRQIGKAADSESVIYWFEPSIPNFGFSQGCTQRQNPMKSTFYKKRIVTECHGFSIKVSQMVSQFLNSIKTWDGYKLAKWLTFLFTKITSSSLLCLTEKGVFEYERGKIIS